MTKILISIPEELLKILDEHCDKLKYERSEFIRMLVRESIYPKDISEIHNRLETIPVSPKNQEVYPKDIHQEKKEDKKEVLHTNTQQKKEEYPIVYPKNIQKEEKEKVKDTKGDVTGQLDQNNPAKVTTVSQGVENKDTPQDVFSKTPNIIPTRCQYPQCSKPNIGKYLIVVWKDGEETKKELYLCNYHVRMAGRGGNEPEKVE